MKTKIAAIILASILLLCSCSLGKVNDSTAEPADNTQISEIITTETPDKAPTTASTEETAETPTAAPTEVPTAATTETPTAATTETPTAAPTEAPTVATTEAPTAAPTEAPTAAPTEAPTAATTEAPVVSPSENITFKGYKIEEINGVTYVDGTLIANKTYGLPADYTTNGLTEEALNAFYQMQYAAGQEGLYIYVLSGFRSYADQSYAYYYYCDRDGQAAADTYSARPGHSEHQTGLAMDINRCTWDFAYSAEGIWLKNHCAEYGFIIRYPEGKTDITGYIYEPWHIRYVGVDLANKLYLGNGNFTTLEEYYGITSNYAY